MIEDQQRKVQEEATANRKAFKKHLNYMALGALVLAVLIVVVAYL